MNEVANEPMMIGLVGFYVVFVVCIIYAALTEKVDNNDTVNWGASEDGGDERDTTSVVEDSVTE